LPNRFDFSDVLIILGLGLLCGGLACYDWRLALVVGGAVLLALGLVAAASRRR
jgi:hypothetical protein